MDAKHRLTVPAKWRFAGDEGEVCMLLPHPDGYLLALPPKQVEALHARVAAVPFGETEAQDFWASLLARSATFGLDAQGRFALPVALREHAGLKGAGEAVLVGQMTVYKIYSPERWARVAALAAGEGLRHAMRRAGF